MRWQTGLPPQLRHKHDFAVSGHCRYATALHGRQLSLLQMEDAYRGVYRGQRTRSAINSRSIFRPPRFLRNLATYRGRVVRELLSHYNNDPLQQINLCGAVVVGGQSASACGVTPWHTGSIPPHEHGSRMSAATARRGVCTARSWDPTARAPACHSTPLGGPVAYGQKAAVRLWCVSDGAVVTPPAGSFRTPGSPWTMCSDRRMRPSSSR